MNLELSGKTVFITGASSGIGAKTAEIFAEEGSLVIIGYNTNKDAAASLAEKIISHGGKSTICQVNLENLESIRETAAFIRNTYRTIDILVLNAGKNIVTPFQEISEKEWFEIININLNGPYFLLKELIPLFNNNGSVVFVASVAGETGAPHHPHYAAAKAGIINLTKSAAKALAPKIRVNCVAPGITATLMGQDTIAHLEEHYAEKKLLAKRFAEPAEIAKTIVFLASPAASFTYGATIDVNGGRELR